MLITLPFKGIAYEPQRIYEAKKNNQNLVDTPNHAPLPRKR
ncbi:hypothetical protein DSUL_100001 [Desulfovibrionales bacterium]